jgi:hypothetical protein
MSKDIFFGKTKRNWSREPAASNPEFAVQAAATRTTNQLTKLKDLKAKADGGDKKAQKKWSKISKKVAKLHLKASKGNLKAAKQLAALTPTGLFVTTVGPTAIKTIMHGTFVGKDEILGTFVGADSVTKIRGNDKRTEIVTSGVFVGDDKLTEIITSGSDKLTEIITSGSSSGALATEILGKDEILGAFVGDNFVHKAAVAPLKIAKKLVTLPFDAAEWALNRAPLPGGSSSSKHAFIGEEERALAAEGGACERAALRRRTR